MISICDLFLVLKVKRKTKACSSVFPLLQRTLDGWGSEAANAQGTSFFFSFCSFHILLLTLKLQTP